MGQARTKLEILYQEVLGDVAKLVDRLDELQGCLPTADVLRSETERLKAALAPISNRIVIVASLAGAAITACLVAGFVAIALASGYWLANPAERKLKEATRLAGVDISSLSLLDLTNRLTYSASDGRLLVDAVGEPERRGAIDDIVAWLRRLRPSDRRIAFVGLLDAVSAAQDSPGKADLMRWIERQPHEVIDMLSMQSDLRGMIVHLAGLPPETRQRLGAGDFSCEHTTKR